MGAIIFGGNFVVMRQLSSGQFFRGAILLGGNYPGGNYPGGNWPRMKK